MFRHSSTTNTRAVVVCMIGDLRFKHSPIRESNHHNHLQHMCRHMQFQKAVVFFPSNYIAFNVIKYQTLADFFNNRIDLNEKNRCVHEHVKQHPYSIYSGN